MSAVETQAKKRGEPEQAGGDDLLGAEAHGELGAEHRHDPHGERDGQQVDTRGERPVALEELEVLGDQEAEARYPEECDGDGTARRGEAKVAEEADVEHRLRCGALAEDEDREQPRCECVAGEAPAAAPAVVGGLDQRVGQQRDRGARENQSRDVGPVRARIARGRNAPRDERGAERRRRVPSRRRCSSS